MNASTATEAAKAQARKADEALSVYEALEGRPATHGECILATLAYDEGMVAGLRMANEMVRGATEAKA